MKAAFLYAFNVLRNISLAIVVCLVFYLYQLSGDPEFQQYLADKMAEVNDSPTALSIAEPVKNNDNQLLKMSFSTKETIREPQDRIVASEMSVKSTSTNSIMSIESTSEEQAEGYQKLFRRLTIKTIEEGYKTDIFILPTEILRLTKDTLHLTSGEWFLYSDKITEIGKKLTDVEGFFVTRQDIINCFHAKKLTPRPNTYKDSRTKHYLQVKDGYEFQVPERKVPLLKNIIKQISL